MTIAAIDSAAVAVPEKIIREAYRRLEIPIDIVRLPPARSIRMSNSGQVDAELARVKVDPNEFPNLIRVPVPIDVIEGAVFSKKLDFEISGWESIKPYRIGIRQGVKFSERGTRGMDVVVASENAQLFRMLETDRVDLIVLNKQNALRVIEQLGITDIRLLEPSIHYLQVYHYLHRQHQDLLPRITQVLDQMTANGEVDQIMRELRGL